jgi:hypothetical protein
MECLLAQIDAVYPAVPRHILCRRACCADGAYLCVPTVDVVPTATVELLVPTASPVPMVLLVALASPSPVPTARRPLEPFP